MTQIDTSAIVEYTPRQMFALVNDPEAYPQYLPMCTAVKIKSRTSDFVTATITLSKGKLNFSFTTTNTFPNDGQIDVNLVEGPFKKLFGRWVFTPTDRGGCAVSFKLLFEFENALLSMAFGKLFKGIAESLVAAFCAEAARRYGGNAASNATGITQTVG